MVRKTTTSRLNEAMKDLKKQASVAFPALQLAVMFVDSKGAALSSSLNMPKSLKSEELEIPAFQGEAISVFLRHDAGHNFLSRLLKTNPLTYVLTLYCDHARPGADLEIAFWRAISRIIDINAACMQGTKQGKDIPSLLYSTHFENTGKSSMRSDLFAALILGFQDQDMAPIKALMTQRANAPFHRSHMEGCEDHPCVIAYDALQFAFETTSTTLDRIKPWKSARRLAVDIVKGFDDTALKGWHDFVKPAREMSLRGYPVSTILSGALAVSDKPHIRSVAHNCAILLDHHDILDNPDEMDYNAFDTDQSNLIRHEHYAKKLFERALQQAKVKSSAEPLHAEANRQNLRLTQGRVVGWCADHLQQAAEEFELSTREKQDHYEALYNKFHTAFTEWQKQSAQSYRQWRGLKYMGDVVLEKKMHNQNTSLSDLREASEGKSECGDIRASIASTMTNPLYLQRVEQAYQMPPSPDFKRAKELAKTFDAQPAPHAPQPKAPLLAPSPFGTVTQDIQGNVASTQDDQS